MQIVRGYWQLDESGFSCQPLGFGKTEQSKPMSGTSSYQLGEEANQAQTAVGEAFLDHIQASIQGNLSRYDE